MLTTAQIVKRTGYSVQAIYSHMQTKEFPPPRRRSKGLGRAKYYAAEDIDLWFKWHKERKGRGPYRKQRK